MAKKKSHGGPRRGSGRKPGPDGELTSKTYRFSAVTLGQLAELAEKYELSESDTWRKLAADAHARDCKKTKARKT